MRSRIVLSSLVLGLFFVALTGAAQAGSPEMQPAWPGGRVEFELKGIELPFPVGWVSENEIATYPALGPLETGGLPESGRIEWELRGVELPFPVGWVPEGRE